MVQQPPLTRREVLVAIESLYDSVLKIEQMRRDKPPPEDEEGTARW
jgi:DNA topoisomerase 2-associated protein PAT1